jgi:PAS domain S-box-containing protein
VGPSFRITQFNHAFERLTGRSVEEVLGKELDILFPEDSREESLALIRKTVAGERWEVVEIPILQKDGAVRTVLWNSAALFASDSKTVVATIAQGQDITERKLAEGEIRQLNENLKQRAIELEAINRELEAFSYSVSHDLRAPLRSMSGFSQALLEDYSDKIDEPGRDYLRRIIGGSELMARLIDDLLELSRVTRSEIRWETVNLSELAQTTVDDIKRTTPERSVEVKISDGLTGYGDSYLLRLVLGNLIGNAWKFTAGRSRAMIEFGTIASDGERVYFVRDNGAGFDMAYADKLFKPFQRLHSATEFPGSGIGLATVQRIIHRLGGRVWAEGKVDQGATFFFTLGNY